MIAQTCRQHRQPNRGWVEQHARNLLMTVEEQRQRPRFLVRDRDDKVTVGFDEIFRSEVVQVIRAPVAAPKAKAHAERWAREVAAAAATDAGVFRLRRRDRLGGLIHEYELAA